MQYDSSSADLRIPRDHNSKKPFRLAAWEERIIRDIYGTIGSNGKRRYTTAYVEVPKKNGKSELGAGIGLYGLFMDNEPGAEIYSVARTRNQAATIEIFPYF
jgi:phage terminase large subunit-like protein